MKTSPITVINGSLGGAEGNTGAVLRPLLSCLRARAEVVEIHLAEDARSIGDLTPILAESRGFVFATGTYWDSWGSPLQAFFEQATGLEGSDVWLGKPAACVVTMHAVGGKGVLSRLQGVLSTLGLLVPPMSGMVYSLAMHLAARHAPPDAAGFLADFWLLEDLDVVGHNLLEAVTGGRRWRGWRVDEGDPERRWMGS
jgi:chromate reductase